MTRQDDRLRAAACAGLLLLAAALGACPVGVTRAAEDPVTPPPAGGAAVLDDHTVWRTFWCLEPSPSCASLAPPDSWAQPDFDDLNWGMGRSVLPGYGADGKTGIQALWLRAVFDVSDAAQVRGLALELTYRGGAAVHLNGREVARANLPAGPVTAETPATAYPAEAYYEPDGKTLLPPSDVPADKYDERYRTRLRSLKAALPSALLRQGVNVLAIQICRAPHPAELPALYASLYHRTPWSTAGFDSAQLTAASANGLTLSAAPRVGVQVANAAPLTEVARTAPPDAALRPLRPLALSAPRNGWASGQVVVSAPQAIVGLSAKAGDLKSAGGDVIPARAITVCYAQKPDGAVYCDNLALTASAQAALQPVWVLVKVPPGAKPGAYTGALEITVAQASSLPPDQYRPSRLEACATSVPLSLTVFDWLLPEPRQWSCWVTFFQSPETVAAYYRVPLWSDEHFAKLRPSLELLGQLGQRLVTVPVLANSILGQEPLLVFRREAGKLVPDFRYVDRYLRLYQECCGKPELLCLQVWDAGGLDGTPLVELQGDHPVPLPFPAFGAPGTKELWQTVLDGTRQRVRELGWLEDSVILGLEQDTWPERKSVDFIKELAPTTGWLQFTHLQESPLLRGYVITPDDQCGLSPIPGWERPFARGYPNAFSARGILDTTALPAYRTAPLTALMNGFNGLAAWGLDSWVLVNEQGRKSRRLYDNPQLQHWQRLVRNTVRSLTFPGPGGALPTVRYEMLREGLQESEALVFIEKNKGSPRLSPAVKARCAALRRDVVASRIQAMNALGRPTDLNWAATRDALYQCAAAVQAELAAPAGAAGP